MLSAGNDIVALSETNVARTLNQQFYSKILSEQELALYNQLSAKIPFECYVWLIWSIKESAYKFQKRLDSNLLFTPVKFEVSKLEIPEDYLGVSFNDNDSPPTITGCVNVNNNRFYSKSLIYKELISSIVDSDESFEGVYWNIKYCDTTENAFQSAEVRSFLIKELINLTGRSALNIQKDQHGIPHLFDDSESLSIPVSLSHHGHYIAYSFKLI